MTIVYVRYGIEDSLEEEGTEEPQNVVQPTKQQQDLMVNFVHKTKKITILYYFIDAFLNNIVYKSYPCGSKRLILL